MRLVRGEICRKIFYLSLAFSWHVSKKEEEGGDEGCTLTSGLTALPSLHLYRLSSLYLGLLAS